MSVIGFSLSPKQVSLIGFQPRSHNDSEIRREQRFHTYCQYAQFYFKRKKNFCNAAITCCIAHFEEELLQIAIGTVTARIAA